MHCTAIERNRNSSINLPTELQIENIFKKYIFIFYFFEMKKLFPWQLILGLDMRWQMVQSGYMRKLQDGGE